MRHWNLFFLLFLTIFFINFYPTYEALKLCYYVKTAIMKYKFLPYLWGIETSILKLEMSQAPLFLPYLWGIETNSRAERSRKSNEFLPYLWGIETF